MSKLLVLDFDGTMTDAEAEGAPFRDGYLTDIAGLTGQTRDAVETLAVQFEAEVAAAPDKFGWMYDGRIVAPATVDPYLRIMPVARRIFDHLGRFTDEQDRTRLLDAILYKYNYQKTLDVPWPNTGAVLRGLAGQAVYIITNSHTDAVQRKVREIGVDGALDWLVERVQGRAQKYVVDSTFDAVPEEMRLPGLARPVLLRRRLYHDALQRLLKVESAQWSDLVVVGDIFELDLALPLAMGARVGLLANAHTPAWEKDFLEGHPRGAVLHDVSEVPDFAALT